MSSGLLACSSFWRSRTRTRTSGSGSRGRGPRRQMLTKGLAAPFVHSEYNFARWNSTKGVVQSRIGNNWFAVILATLENNTGTPLQALGISYYLGGEPHWPSRALVTG